MGKRLNSVILCAFLYHNAEAIVFTCSNIITGKNVEKQDRKFRSWYKKTLESLGRSSKHWIWFLKSWRDGSTLFSKYLRAEKNPTSTEITINLTVKYVSQNLWLDSHEVQIFDMCKCSSCRLGWEPGSGERNNKF